MKWNTVPTGREDIAIRLQQARSIPEIFMLVKKAVNEILGAEQAGLMLGLAELGISSNGFVGAFYSPSSNIIVMNRTAMRRVKSKNSAIYNDYCFHILMHEYLHSIGFYDEAEARQLTYMVSRELLGEEHMATKLALGYGDILGGTYANIEEEPRIGDIEFVTGLDRESANYIM
ncbi:hypothetical protein HYU15_02530 [Candidatus Woesearchaeota archaeon]|nr:hypothetical protein [Candidatus Woesearchaeota archaeon]